MYLCISICMYVGRYIWMYVCMFVCMYVCMYVYMYACIHVCIHACMHLCMYLCMYFYVYMFASVYGIIIWFDNNLSSVCFYRLCTTSPHIYSRIISSQLGIAVCHIYPKYAYQWILTNYPAIDFYFTINGQCTSRISYANRLTH